MLLFVRSSPTVSRQVTRQVWGQTRYPTAQAQQSGPWPGTCYDTARDKQTYNVDQTNRDQKPRMELKWAWIHEQKGWKEPTGEVDQGLLAPSGLWHFLELPRTVINTTQTEDNEILDPELTISESTVNFRTSLDVSRGHPTSFSVQPNWR